ncbi:SBBP repeat-containing protein [Pleurocapsales cyanobacterium LEGE 10410]|nr:SBBP repeat-containing protein [Pleurocapsales cyanobacterium LEGE 10410]
MSTFNDNAFDLFFDVSSNILRSVVFSDIFGNLLLEVVDIFTPSSNYNALRAEQEIDFVWGRHGNDSLIDFSSGDAQLNQRQIDIFFGDFVDENIYELFGLVDEGLESTPRDWQDRFILGDWQQPYYIDDPLLFGLNQFALIADFSLAQDLIQLHGTPQDYQLLETPLGTALFWQQEIVPNLVALLPGVFDLSLNEEFFQFEGDTPPPGPVIEDALQIGTAGIDLGLALSTDLSGNVYVGGWTDSALGESNSGLKDAWLAKFDGNGNQLWSEQFGTSGVDSVWAIANDANGVYVVGNTTGALGKTNQGGRDVYLAKFDREGNQTWLQQFGSAGMDISYGVTTDQNGNIYVSSQTLGDLGGANNNTGQNFLDFTESKQSAAVPTTDSVVAKFDSDGEQLWIEKFGTAELDDFYNIAIDRQGNIFAGGPTTSDWGGDHAGLYDSWLVKVDNNGQLDWIEQFGTPAYDFLWDVDTDSEGNVYATGWTLGDLGEANAGSYDAWVVKYDSDGNQLWSEQFGTSGDDASVAIEVDLNNNIFLTGHTDSDLGGANAGSYDAWVVKYDGDGNQLWEEQLGTANSDYASEINADSLGNLYVIGWTEGSLGELNAGSIDAWVTKLDAETGIVQNFSGDAFNWGSPPLNAKHEV